MTKAAARVKTPAAAFSLFTEAPAGMSSLRWPVRKHGIYACGHLFPSFSLERKVSEKFKAASIGPPRGCLNA
jgi:hypothetical protein